MNMVSFIPVVRELMMSRVHALSLAGQRFGRWTVKSKGHTNERGEIFWLCHCDCGSKGEVRASNLTGGTSTSCGCYHKDAVTSHGMTKSRTWKSYDSMHQRCGNPKSPDYHRYGGRGIRVAPMWHSFDAFLADMGERPDGTSLERIDVDGDYSPANCRWANASEQQRNRTDARRATFQGVTKNIHDWADELGIPAKVIAWRLEKSWSDQDALTKPVRAKAR